MAKGLFSRLPKGALTIAKELARHILRRPVVGVAVAGGGGRAAILGRHLPPEARSE